VKWLALFSLALTAGALVFAAKVVRDSEPSSGPLDGALNSIRDRLRGGSDERADVGALPAARCPPRVAGCRTARGRIVLVEAVDPDGDGDLHVVVTGGSVTAPGFSAIDVRAGLRPKRDPRIGDVASAAGPVQTGSYGQRQIHALVFRTRRR
jgi:hypothetical protein